MNQKVILIGISLVLLVALIATLIASNAYAQSAITFSTQDNFSIPHNNSTINFAYDGSYLNASFENDAWLFQNLIVNNYTLSHIPTWCLAISAISSNVTITSYSAGALTGLANAAAWLNYTVGGKGTQMVNLDYGYSGGLPNQYIVYVDGVNSTQGNVWTFSDDGSLTISGATSNVSIYYPPKTDVPTETPSPSPTPSPTIPEFPPWLILPFLMAATAFGAILIRRRKGQ